ncbi:coproporphyrinogen-III oxidase family protein [Olivibacter sp. CPCC 100613]|uniref:coproporphyrinogen-III oxidase family protein n=1 Tax=Olivibacter sp. CPCC 100613 TaxID=3079931 RepID=UPI002FF907E3
MEEKRIESSVMEVPSDLSSTHLSTLGEPSRDEFYTNYPFFKYWSSAHNLEVQQPKGINIYIHIPFCIQICDFCFYMKELIKSKDQVDQYVQSVCAEIKIVSERFALTNRKVNAVYIGGGTPSVLTERQLNILVETLNKYHNIAEAEFTFEAEPGTFTATKLSWYRDCGINRISMGVQSFNDEIIKLSSRKHTSQQAVSSVKLVQDYNSFKLNIDLLSGLAGETMTTWRESVNTALGLQVDMLTIYKMKTYANTVFFQKGVHKNDIVLPSKDEEIAFMTEAINIIYENQYELWTNFAFTKDGSKHFYAENTWRGEDLVAYGNSSFGNINGFNYQNLNNLPAYSKKVSDGEMPIYRSYKLTYKDKIIKELLLCASRLVSYSKAEFINKFGFDYFELIPEHINSLIGQGYIENNWDELVPTRKGILFGDFVSKTIAEKVKDVLGKDKIGFSY